MTLRIRIRCEGPCHTVNYNTCYNISSEWSCTSKKYRQNGHSSMPSHAHVSPEAMSRADVGRRDVRWPSGQRARCSRLPLPYHQLSGCNGGIDCKVESMFWLLVLQIKFKACCVKKAMITPRETETEPPPQPL